MEEEADMSYAEQAQEHAKMADHFWSLSLEQRDRGEMFSFKCSRGQYKHHRDLAQKYYDLAYPHRNEQEA